MIHDPCFRSGICHPTESQSNIYIYLHPLPNFALLLSSNRRLFCLDSTSRRVSLALTRKMPVQVIEVDNPGAVIEVEPTNAATVTIPASAVSFLDVLSVNF